MNAREHYLFATLTHRRRNLDLACTFLRAAAMLNREIVLDGLPEDAQAQVKQEISDQDDRLAEALVAFIAGPPPPRPAFDPKPPQPVQVQELVTHK